MNTDSWKIASVVSYWHLWCLRLFHPNFHWTLETLSLSFSLVFNWLSSVSVTPLPLLLCLITSLYPLLAILSFYSSVPGVTVSWWLNWLCSSCVFERGAQRSRKGSKAVESNMIMGRERCWDWERWDGKGRIRELGICLILILVSWPSIHPLPLFFFTAPYVPSFCHQTSVFIRRIRTNYFSNVSCLIYFLLF